MCHRLLKLSKERNGPVGQIAVTEGLQGGVIEEVQGGEHAAGGLDGGLGAGGCTGRAGVMKTDGGDGKGDQGVEGDGGCSQPGKGWPTLVCQDAGYQADLQEGWNHIEYLHESLPLAIAAIRLVSVMSHCCLTLR